MDRTMPTKAPPSKLSDLAAASRYGERDARRAIADAKRKAAVRAASPAGLLALFPALKGKT